MFKCHPAVSSTPCRLIGLLLATCCLAGCTAAPLTESGRLSTYAALKPSDGILTKTKVRVDKKAVLSARSALLMPTLVADGVASSGLSAKQLGLVTNAINRALCRNLSQRFVMVDTGQPADLLVQVVITHVARTDTTSAGASVVTNIGTTVAGAVTGLPLPSLRIPLGMGSLTVEAEAKDQSNQQLAALVWARGADAFMTKPRVAAEADAYTLAGEFADDFATLLVNGTDPIADLTLLTPSAQSVGEYFGGAPKHAVCRQFGKHPGFGNTVGDAVGLPPEWTDNGAAKPKN
jgi:Protein of unknown function (DUF3313)